MYQKKMNSFWIAAFLIAEIVLAAESVVLPRSAPGAFRGKTLVLIRCGRLLSYFFWSLD